MKKVFSSNSEIAHIWAQQNHSKGETPNGNVFFFNKTIYSYGYHFPIAHFLNADMVLINDDSYSNSTSKQQSHVRNSISHKIHLYADTDVIKLISETFKYDAPTGYALQWFKKRLKELALKNLNYTLDTRINAAARRRMQHLRDSDLHAAKAAYNSTEQLLKHFNIKMPIAITRRVDALHGADTQAILDSVKAAATKRKATQRKKETKKRNEAIKNFYAGNRYEASYLRNEPVLLREREGMVQTSQGAEFPSSQAIEAFIHIKRCRTHATSWRRNGQSIKLGYYQIDTISDKGDVKAGCHSIKYKEMERMYIELTTPQAQAV